jgi:hypothetical protein
MDDKPTDTGTYEVGYRKPPKSGQFQKGQSGNPRGRPKGARGVKTVLDEALRKEITKSEGGQTSRVTKREALILSLITKALKGDIRAVGQVLKLIEQYDEAPMPKEGGLTVHVIDQFDDPQ